jgi:hypothetical protein
MDRAEYERRVRESRDEGRCFICRIVAGSRSHQIVYEDAGTIAFLNQYPTLIIAPLPPGVPPEQQQYYALMMENGVLDLDESSQAALAQAIRSHL